MYGQMTAGSWIYIGTQGILQGTYETFAAVAAKRFGGTLAGTLTVTGGCGGMGGAQPLAVTMNDGVCLIVDVDRSRLERRVERALPRRGGRRARRRPGPLRCRAVRPAPAVGGPDRQLRGGAPRAAAPRGPRRRGHGPDLSARPVVVPAGRGRLRGLALLRRGETRRVHRPGPGVDGRPTSRRWSAFMDAGAEVFDYGNSIRGEAKLHGYERAFDFPGFVPAYIRPLFCEGKGPFRWAALSGDPKDIAATDRAVLELFPDNEPLARWIQQGRGASRVPGAARADLLAGLRRTRQGRRAVQRHGRLRRGVRAPGHRPGPPRLRVGGLAVPRDRVDARRVRRDRRLAAAQRDGQRRVRCVVGVDPPRRRRGHRSIDPRGAGLRRGRHQLAGEKIRRVLTNDPGMGVIRHVDAGYDEARDVARERGVAVPMADLG